MDENTKKAQKEIAFYIACMTLNLAYKDIKQKRLSKLKKEKRYVALFDAETFIESDWFDSVCMIARVDETRLRKKFEDTINERYEFFGIDRQIENREPIKAGWEIMNNFNHC